MNLEIEQQYEEQLDKVKRETLGYISSLVNKYSKEEIKILMRTKLINMKKDHLIDMFMYWIDEYFKDFYTHTEYSTPDERKGLRDYYSKVYREKAKEVTGSDKYADGKPKLPMFGKKENTQIIKLFKMFGIQTLRNMIEIFFSDEIDQVREFTRGKKAGYGFSIFYSMVPKLSVIKGIDNIPCDSCKGILKHKSWCEKSFVKIKEQEYEEIRAEKIDIHLTENFWNKVKGEKSESA